MQLTKYDLNRVLQKVPERVLDLIKAHDGIIAGGFIRSTITRERISDLDIFFHSKQAATAFIDALAGPDGSSKIYIGDNALGFTVAGGLLVQAVHRWTFADAADVVCHFDFTIACAAVFWVTGSPGEESLGMWSSRCHTDFYADLASRRLIYTSPLDPEPGSTMLRLLKFTSRGFSITLQSLAKLITAMAIVAEPSIDAEKFRAKVLTKLVEVDPITKRKDFVQLEMPE